MNRYIFIVTLLLVGCSSNEQSESIVPANVPKSENIVAAQGSFSEKKVCEGLNSPPNKKGKCPEDYESKFFSERMMMYSEDNK
jgi:hypothetical protein